MVLRDGKERGSGFDTAAVVICGAALLVFLYAAALFLQGGFRAVIAQEYEAKVLTPVDPAVEEVLAAQRAQLTEGPRWLDKDQGRVGLPIDLAKQLVVQRKGRVQAEGSP